MSDFLDINRASQAINLMEQNLNTASIRPFFKALQHQHCLTSLHLSNNLIQDEGVKYLAQALPTIKQLSVLDLSGNLINDRGIEYLANAFEKQNCLRELTELNLNFNPLKSSSLR